MKDEKIGALVESVEKQFGRGTIRELGSDPQPPQHGVISTGSLALNHALGVGGIPKGVVTEIHGGTQAVALAVQLVSESQRAGGVVAYIDANHRLDLEYAKAVGVSTDRLLVSQPDSGEQAFDIADVLARSGAVDLIVVDSADVLAPKSALEGNIFGDDVLDGERARFFSKGLVRLTGVAYRTGVAIVFLRSDDRPLPAAHAIKFYSSVRMQLSVERDVVVDEKVIGTRVAVRISKNKFAPPFQQAHFELRNDGIDKASDLLEFAIGQGVVSLSGSPVQLRSDFALGDEHIGTGWARARERLMTDAAMADRIRAALAAKAGR
jgi:recombination protein RecA